MIEFNNSDLQLLQQKKAKKIIKKQKTFSQRRQVLVMYVGC